MNTLYCLSLWETLNVSLFATAPLYIYMQYNLLDLWLFSRLQGANTFVFISLISFSGKYTALSNYNTLSSGYSFLLFSRIIIFIFIYVLKYILFFFFDLKLSWLILRVTFYYFNLLFMASNLESICDYLKYKITI